MNNSSLLPQQRWTTKHICRRKVFSMFLDRNESGLDSDIRHTAPVSGGVGGVGRILLLLRLCPPTSLNRPNKLRDHGNCQYVCVCFCLCVRRELEGWGGFTLHELMNFAVMIFKSRMIPAGINYILVILLLKRGAREGWVWVGGKKIISWSMHITEWKL